MNYFITNNDFGRYRPHLWLAIACLCFFFLWAGLAEIDQQVRGLGKIIPSGKIRAIQNLEGGIIREIFVKEGQIVKANDALFQLTNTRAEA